MLVGSEEELARQLCTALGLDPKDDMARNAWENLARVLIAHMLRHSIVVGIAPPNGGPVSEGRLA